MKTLLVLSLLIGSSAMAQTSVSSQTQITQTRDFVSGLLNQISTTSKSSRFSGSTDYSRSGLELQQKIAEKLARFRDAMTNLSTGALAISVDEYNALTREQSLSAEEKSSRMKLQLESLQIQSRAANTIYQAALDDLYQIAPELYVTKAEDWEYYDNGYRTGLKVQCLDGSRFKAKTSQRNWAIQQQIAKVLKNVCTTKICYSSMLADYTYFYSSIATQLNHDLTVSLADGNSIVITANGKKNDYILSGISNFSFDTDEFRKLIDRN